MAYQVPGSDHPWRRYKNKQVKESNKKDENEKDFKAVKILVTELAEGWDKIEITTYAYGREGKFYLTELPQSRQAAWLAGVLKRNYQQ